MGPLIASLLCALPRWRLWQNCHFRHICQICRFCQLLWAPFTALCFSRWRLWQNCHFRHICQVRRFCQLLCAPSLLCALLRCRLWENCHFRHIAKFRCFGQLLWAPFTALCFSSLAIVAKLSFSSYLPNSPLSPTFMGPLHYFVYSLVGDCGKIVIFAIFTKFATLANFYGPPSTALCFASLAIVAKLSFSPYLRNSPLSPTFMGPLHYFVFFLVGDCGKIVIFAIFAKFAAFANFYGPPSLLCVFIVGDCAKIVIFAIFAAFANFYGPPSLLCVFPRWRLWQNCHFRHICQIRQHFLIFAIFVVVCISGHISLIAGYSALIFTPAHEKDKSDCCLH